MSYFLTFFALIITVVLVLDIFTMLKCRKQVDEYKYRVFNWINVITMILAILFLISSVESILSYFKSHWEIHLSNAYIFLILVIQFSLHSLSNNYICGNGIWYWGHLYKWNEIEAYCWSNDEKHVIFRMKKKLLGIESQLNFTVKECLREEVKIHLISNLGNLKTI